MRKKWECAPDGHGQAAGWRWAAVLFMAGALVACGGGGGGSGANLGQVAALPPAAPDTGLLEVSATDPFDAPVRGADVSFTVDEASGSRTFAALTDADGRASLRVPPASGFLVVNTHPYVMSGETAGVTVPEGGRVQVSQVLRAMPSASPLAIASAEVTAEGTSADGRSLRLRLDLNRVPVPQDPDALYGDSYVAASLVDCIARSGDALAALGSRCVDRGDGSDRSWRAVERRALTPPEGETGTPLPPAVLLMLDRSEFSVIRDPFERRLYSAKALASALLPQGQVAVAAFAGDGGPSGTASPLPAVPVTFSGGEDSPFFATAEGAITAIESLRGRVGGSAPLHAAIAAGLEFLAARAEPGRSRALVLLTDGRDDDCRTVEACASLSRDVATRARALGVTVYVVAPGTGDDGDRRRDVLEELDRADGIVRVVEPMYWDFMGAVEIVRSAIQGGQVLSSVGFTIDGEVAGSFRSGDVVQGVLEHSFSGGMGGITERLGFSVRVP